MIHPHTELRFISDEIGFGVVATKFIPKGTITWVLDKFDREFTPKAFLEFDKPYQDILDFYAYRNASGNYILCWDHARFVNHSFNSNCLTTAYDFEIAIRDIQPGEQLTDDYGYLNIEVPFKPIDEGTRRRIVYPDDTLRYHKVWDKKIASVFPLIEQLDQPLSNVISKETWNVIRDVNEGSRVLDSIINTYCYPEQIG
jgi:hypothetical protein